MNILNILILKKKGGHIEYFDHEERGEYIEYFDHEKKGVIY